MGHVTYQEHEGYKLYVWVCLFGQDLSAWDVATVRDMRGVHVEVFDNDISAWNASRVTDMINNYSKTPKEFSIPSDRLRPPRGRLSIGCFGDIVRIMSP
jgi:hypothetical protein